MTLTSLKPGQSAKIKYIDSSCGLCEKLQVLGCTEGTEVCLKRKTPLLDPIIISFRNCEFALRKADAKKIFVEQI